MFVACGRINNSFKVQLKRQGKEFEQYHVYMVQDVP